jgi:ferritin
MLSKSVSDAMNEQINNEFYAAHIYLSMSAYFESLNLPGFARWMRAQAQEETEHAMKFFDHINDRGGRVTLKPIAAPPAEFDSPLAAFEAAHAHEKKVTAMINNIYAIVLKENDYPARSMLQWFADEQVEEEKNTLDIVEQLKMIGDNKMGLLMLDRELGQRSPAGEDEG